jgi:hypothetical protein
MGLAQERDVSCGEVENAHTTRNQRQRPPGYVNLAPSEPRTVVVDDLDLAHAELAQHISRQTLDVNAANGSKGKPVEGPDDKGAPSVRAKTKTDANDADQDAKT